MKSVVDEFSGTEVSHPFHRRVRKSPGFWIRVLEDGWSKSTLPETHRTTTILLMMVGWDRHPACPLMRPDSPVIV